MNHEENKERDTREEQRTGTQRDIKDIKFQIDRLTGAVGELVTAFKGNDLGTEGMVAQVKTIVDEQKKLKDRLDAIESAAKGKETYVRIIWGLICFVSGTLFVYLLNRLIPIKK